VKAIAALLLLLQDPVRFEVASVKQAVLNHQISPVMRGGPGTSDPERITWEQVTLARLLSVLYGINFDQISGPDWVGTDRYAILAKLPPGTTKEQLKVMWQNLLAERFHLKTHFVKKAFPAYELTEAKGGSKLRAGPLKEQPGFPVPRPGQYYALGMAGPRHVRLTFRDASMAEFADRLGWPLSAMVRENELTVGRVVDKTGLEGKYSFTLEFAGQWGPGGAYLEAPPDGAGDTVPNLFDALWQQLGLKLEEKKTQLDVLVIDHVDRVPTEN
jgi:uncharacterized protein (TIGR03435 family)